MPPRCVRREKPGYTDDEIREAVRKALKTLKGSDMRKTTHTIAVCAHRYTRAPVLVIERVIKALDDAQRIDLGFADSSADQLSGIRTSPDLGGVGRWRPPGHRPSRI